ncbi:MAG TPA: glycosyltransferase family 2 protein [Bryobacteraceae bacterium]|nr:glycosyltransferase family 2 protein [Bryobacteraceae bacterium]
MIGVVVVTYNSAEVIGRCLDSCTRIPDLRVVVVDNASSDETRKNIRYFPSVVTICNEENRGFAAAVNQGVAALDTPYILLLNPDAELAGGLEALVRRLEQDETAGAVTGRLIGPNGQDQSKFHLRRLPTAATLAFEALGLNRALPWNPVNRRYRRPALVGEVQQPAAAFLLIRRAAWAALGGFDEDFHPIWFEDVDFCKRLGDSGWTIAYEPAAVARHIGGHSASAISWEAQQLFWYGSLLKYAVRHFSTASRSLVCLAVMAACLPRTVAALLLRRSLEPVVVYSKVFQLAGGCLLRRRSDTVSARTVRQQVRRASAAG